MPPEDLARLAKQLDGRLISTAAERLRAGRDASPIVGAPRAVVYPSHVEDVVTLVRWARRTGVPLTARAVGTSLDGESVPVEGGLAVDFGRWNLCRSIDPVERVARVEPGLVNLDLQRRAARHGLFFPPNPGSSDRSTIGGNVATNASGPRSFRYGPTRAWVRGVSAVLGTGETVTWGSAAPKRSMGPDLVSLLVGSEGTLALFTELRVGLAPLPARRLGLFVPWDPEQPWAGLLALARGRDGRSLSALEYLDPRASAALRGAVEGARGPDRGLLLLEIESSTASEERRALTAVERILRSAGADGRIVRFPDAEKLWRLRGAAGAAIDPAGTPRVREDVAVPRARIDELRRRLDRIARNEAVPMVLYGHLGEASLHPNFGIDPASPKGRRIRAQILRAAQALGGTASAEHGIGSIKRGFVAAEIDPPGLRLLREMKKILDPDGILNPGKLLPPAGRTPSRSPSAAAAAGRRRG
ncbi:MAG: FAD-binding oxidoreductase [Thermoplasmata archaeon]